MPPTYGSGKICYIELPATDIAVSSTFYQKVFGWEIRKRGDGRTAFDDGVGQVSGAWVLGRPAQGAPGLLVYILVDSAEKTVELIKSHAGSQLHRRSQNLIELFLPIIEILP